MTHEEIICGAEGIIAENECRELMDRCSYMFSNHQNNELLSMWAERGDTYLEMPWGGYVGIDGVRKFFTVENCDLTDERAKELYTGTMELHSLGTFVAEAAGDGETVRILWGTDSALTYRRKKPDGDTKWGGWSWNEMGVDFLKVDGQWKIWHVRIFPIMLSNTKI